MAITPEVIQIAQDSRERIRAMSDQQVVDLTRAWVDAWDELLPEFQDAYDDLVTKAADGTLSRSTVSRHDRLRAALDQAEAMLEELARETSEVAIRDLPGAVRDATATHAAIGQAQLPQGPAVVGVTFDRLAVGSLDAIVERTTQRIHASTRYLSDDAIVKMKSNLIRGISVGANPRRVASKMVRETEGLFNGGLTRAVAIARTEMLDAHRESTRQSGILNDDLLSGWAWHAQFDTRTCPSCLSNHGSLHPVDEFGPIDHVQGRCVRIDVTKSWKELGFNVDIPEPKSAIQDAETWFNGLDDVSKVSIMGPTRLGMLNDGKIGWKDLTHKVDNPDWRSSMQNTPIKNLIG